MAEQLRYEQTLQRLNMPNVDFAAEKELIRGYNQISAKLDQMSSFFMKQSEGMAKIEGAEYGAENAPTPDQIKDAFSSGKELELPGDKYSVYGTAARSAALTAVYDDITLAAKTQILSDLTDYERNEKDPELLRDKFNTIIDGYAATFDETSPALARKFRADMGIYAYSKVSTESSAFIKNEKDQRIATYAAGAELFLDNGLRTLILGAVNESVTEDGTGDVTETRTSGELITDLIIEEKRKMLSGAIATGFSESQVTKLANAYDARVLQIQSNIVLEEMYKQGSDQRGVFYARVKQAVEKGPNSKVALELPPSVRAALFSTKADDRNTIVNNLRTGWNNIMDDTTKEIGFNNTVREDKVLKSGISFNQQLIIYNDSTNEAKKSAALVAMENSLTILKQSDPEKYLEFKRAYDLHTKKGDGDMSFALQNDVNTEALFEMDIVRVNPQYNMSDVVAALNNKKITFDYYKTMVQKYSNLYDDDFKAAISRMKQELGVPSDMYLDKTWLNSQQANVLSAAISAMNTARRNDTSGTFDADQWVTNNLPTIMTQQIPGQSGQDAALVQRMKGYTRQQVLDFIDKANEAGDQERLRHWEKALRDTDALFNPNLNPNFDQTKLPLWSLD
tara:strand:+ start:798 stop:2663 length:1866 start_codon:yes stop_codon:yes gene_type:complete